MIGGLIGGIVFLVFFLFLKAGLFLSLFIGAAGTAAAWLLTGNRRGMDILVEGVTDEELKSLIMDIKERTDTVSAYLPGIHDRTVTAMVSGILTTIHQIVRKLKSDTRYVKISRRFFSYYLDTLIKILGNYAELEGNRDLGTDVVTRIDKVKGALVKIHEAFKGHHRRLLEGDMMSLDAEIALLEKTASRELNGE
ncbi:MAG: hypothetical protein GYA56_06645 [Geobacteraceae bacterium]|nr:hypothetical protein [Geobacteraceae bacterium]